MKFFTTKEAASRLDVSYREVGKMCRTGLISYVLRSRTARGGYLISSSTIREYQRSKNPVIASTNGHDFMVTSPQLRKLMGWTSGQLTGYTDRGKRNPAGLQSMLVNGRRLYDSRQAFLNPALTAALKQPANGHDHTVDRHGLMKLMGWTVGQLNGKTTKGIRDPKGLQSVLINGRRFYDTRQDYLKPSPTLFDALTPNEITLRDKLIEIAYTILRELDPK